VLLTAFDVLIILAMGDPLRGRPVKMFEYLIAALVSHEMIMHDQHAN
jgi:metal iron transporter